MIAPRKYLLGSIAAAAVVSAAVAVVPSPSPSPFAVPVAAVVEDATVYAAAAVDAADSSDGCA